MLKSAAVLVVALALFVTAGCGDGDVVSTGVTTGTTAAPSSGVTDETADASSSTDTTEAATGDGSAVSSQVLNPHDLLSAAEASAIVGLPVTLEEATLYQDDTSGIISERYAYDLDGTGIHALVEVHQDSLKTSGSVADDFAFENKLSKNEVEPYDLGDEAFVFSNTGQLHMLYDGYYIVVAFDADPYSTDKNAGLNTRLGAKILENLKAKLQ